MSVPSIPGYRIEKLLGEGGMAKVYLAVQESFGRQVALKIMAPELAKGDPQYGERFLREARIVAQLTHPNIVTVFEVGEKDGLHYLSMEYIPGNDLRLRRESLSLKQNLQAIKQIALALDFAHKKGYIHRDVKPENILIHQQDERAVLTDFGIARIAGAQENLTQTGTAIGTPSFMSPEQALGKPIDYRSDLYSLGVVLFYVITGRVPFTADSAVAIGLQHAVEPVPRLEGAFIQFQPVLEKIMAKQADKRYQSGQEFADIIDGMAKKLSAETEQLWRESLAPPSASQQAVAERAQVIPPKPLTPKPATPKVASPKQLTPLIAKRETHSTTETNTATRSSRVVTLLFLFLIGGAIAIALKPEWREQANLLIFNRPIPHQTNQIAPVVSAPSAELPAVDNTKLSGIHDASVNHNDTPIVEAAPAPMVAVEASKSNEFDQFALAKQLLDSGDLIEPEAQNAESVYRAILQSENNNAAAKEGLVNVGIALAARGLRFADNGDLNRAQRDYERALLLAPRDRDVQLLRQRLALLNHDKDASDLVVKAKAALKNNRWLLPDGDNAQDYFRRALEIQPANRDAIKGSQELEQLIANRIRLLWKNKQFVEASDLLALAQKKYIASDVLDAVAAQTVAAATQGPQRISSNENSGPTVNNSLSVTPNIQNLSVKMETDPVSEAKFLQAHFDFQGATENTMLSARVANSAGKKMVNNMAIKLDQTNGSSAFTIANLDEKFPDDQYHLELYLGDRKLAEVNFKVGR